MSQASAPVCDITITRNSARVFACPLSAPFLKAATPTEGGSPVEIDQFVERQNIAHYAERLKTEPDRKKRTTLEQLLAEEKFKQASHAKVEM